MAEIIRSYRELRVYQLAFETAMEVFLMSKEFPAEEKYSLTDQMRRSSRSVCLNLGEAWRKRRYKAAFIAKLNDCETEACETQISIEFAYRCSYISEETFQVFYDKYEKIISQLVLMIDHSEKWIIKQKKNE